ncbi:MAG: anti-sigma factor [Acidimicrobiia bacterium]|nr:anti-sigma factor [Acidimicrobiia bacterium]NNL27620.1 anti-sigma factor [Acidimicrobiia bacterium]
MNELHELVTDYLLGNLSDIEQHAFENHLPECSACTAEIEALTGGVEALFFGQSEAPPQTLRQNVMAAVDDAAWTEPVARESGVDAPRASNVVSMTAKREWTPRMRRVSFAAAAVLALVVGVGVLPQLFQDRIDQITGARDAVVLAVDPTLGPADQKQMSLTYSADEAGAVLVATGLEPLGGDATYQMWLIGDEGPVSAGLFKPDDSGSVSVELTAVPQPGTAFGVTVEPAGGSPLPTGPVLFLANV